VESSSHVTAQPGPYGTFDAIVHFDLALLQCGSHVLSSVPLP
jgi:hypothetical protein